ncbi:hypothetical protein OSTOST_15986, partial [Ostertagia ostertagi]
AQKLSEQLMKMSEQYFSNVVIMFYGDDFRFTTPFEWKIQYEALRFLFDEINSKNEIEIGFGTITKFFDVLEEWYTGKERDQLLSKETFSRITSYNVLLNRESGPIAYKGNRSLKVVNTLPYPMEDVVSVRINNAMVEVEFDGQSIEAQIEPYIRDGKIDREIFRLVFRVHLRPLGISTYRLLFNINQTSTQFVTIAYSNKENDTELD